MAPGVDQKLVAEQLRKNYQSDKGIQLAMNVLLIKKDNHWILFDTGAGSGMGPSGGWLIDNLRLGGIVPEQITDIFTTHAHLDHVGGLVSAEGTSIFPNATIYLSRIEHEFWTKGKADFSKSKLNDQAMIQMMDKMINSILEVVAPQLKLVEDGETILDCIKVEIAPGHTDGHMIATISSDGASIVHIADIVHAEVLLFEHPEWGTGFDSNFDLGVKTRIKVLERLSTDNELVIGFHLPYPGVGHVKKIAGASYQWLPTAFASPQE